MRPSRFDLSAVRIALAAPLLLLTTLFAGPAYSDNGASAGAFDERQARMLAAACYNCHGTEGRLGEEGVPAIAGVPSHVLRAQLQAFKVDEMPGATVMNRIVGGYTEAELTLLAEYFAARRAAELVEE
jgi:cytochrome subunit of sulfide dehydrogenase